MLIHSNKRKEELDKDIIKIHSSRFMGFRAKPMKKGDLLQFLAKETFEKEAPKTEKTKKRSVLIANDNEVLLGALSMQVGHYADTIYTAKNVTEAMTLYTTHAPDMILSDLDFGKNEDTGYDLLEQIRSKNMEVGFYVMSGSDRSMEEKKALSKGATGYIQMPLKRAILNQIFG